MTPRPWFPLALAAAVAVPLPLIWFLVYASPFGSPFGASIPAASLAPALAAAALEAALAYNALDASSARSFGRRLVPFVLLSLGAPIAGGAFLHPDFYGAVFMATIQGICMVLYRGELFYGDRPFSTARSGFYRFGLAASVLFTGWLCLMGYALVTRSEPRWTESLIYNIYNAVLAAALYFCTVRTIGNAKRAVSATGTSFLVDGLDFGPVIGPVACEIAAELFAAGKPLGCGELRARLKGEPCDCDFVNRPGFCADYSAMYNAVLKVGRLAEALRIGTIESLSEGPPTERLGWRFAPAEGVRVDAPEEGTR